MAAWTTIIGIDENGLGPRLGPLVVTGVRLACSGPASGLAALRRATGIDDSKRVFSPARRARGEALALGVLDAAGRGGPSTAASLLERLAVPAPWEAPAACPADPGAARRALCPALAGGSLPRWSDAAADVGPGLRALGFRVERVALAVLCPGTLNAALAACASKLAVDLRLFESVASTLAGDGGGAEVVCGKVGGTDRYAGRFVEWRGRRVRAIRESRERSTYEVAGVGVVSFVRDADGTEPAVAMASVVGKYVRETWMDRLARAFGWPGEAPSGYHDGATTRFLAHAREACAAGASRFPEACLLRAR